MWGIMGIFVRGLSEVGFSSYEVSFIRCILAGTVFLIIKAIKQPSILKIDLKGLIICIMYGVIAYATSFTLYGISVERIPVAVLVSNMIGSTGTKMDMIGVLAGLVYGFLGAALCLSFVTDFSFVASQIVSADMKLLFDLFGVGILCTMVANVCFVKATLYIDTTTCSILSALEVVVGAIVGILIFNESMTAIQVIGAVIVVVASLGSTALNSIKEKINSIKSSPQPALVKEEGTE